MPTNNAAWLTAFGKPFEVKEAPYNSSLDAHQVIIKCRAITVNQTENVIQTIGDLAFSWMKLPAILGTDLAGEIAEVGSAVTRFKVGDRVVGNTVGLAKEINSNFEGAFQQYATVREQLVAHIPANLSFEEACVLPLGASTAACGLYQKDQLDLQYPTVPARKATGETLIVWGASTGVGMNAVQLAVASGYEVFATASTKNHEKIKSLGASQCFDYKYKNVVSEIIKAMRGKKAAGILAIGAGSANPCGEIISGCKGNKFVSMANYPVPDPLPTSFRLPILAYNYVTWSIAWWIKSKLRGVKSNFIFGSTLVHNGVGKAIYEDFLPEALAEGKYTCAPDAQIIGHGLENVQECIEQLKRGVSAKKMVVTL